MLKRVLIAVSLMMMIGSVNAAVQSLRYSFSTALTTPNVTETLLTMKNGEFINNHNWVLTIAGINTNVIVRAEGSVDASSWFNCNATGVDTTITADGTHNLNIDNLPLVYTRLRFVSESGGTTATINAKYIGSN